MGGGFANWKQQEYFDKCVVKLVQMLVSRIRVEKEHPKWCKKMRKLCDAIEYMEKCSERLHKISEPLKDLRTQLETKTVIKHYYHIGLHVLGLRITDIYPINQNQNTK